MQASLIEHVSPPGGEQAATPIAVIGLWCWYPGAPDPRSLWEGVLARRREFRRMPDVRLPLSSYHDPDPAAPDKTYGRMAALIDGFRFDWAAHRIPRRTYDSTDIAQWLALDVAARAIADAGYAHDTLPRERTGVVLGNTLTGEHTRASAMRTRWPFVERALRAAAGSLRLPDAERAALERAMEGAFKSAFAPVTEDTLAGGLSNTIAGRICNHFDLHGGGYTVDGACASSLLAVCDAAARLHTGDLDLALAGGVDISLDTFELIGFAKTGALTPGEMRVYDQRGDGFIPGEGCAFVVLRRLEDALAHGDHVYAVLRGWGVSSDGKGGLTAPSRAGQAKALRRAYARAGYDMRALSFIEGHGTGTRVGDRTEIEAIAAALAQDGAGAGPAPARTLGVTSLKSLIGHTKAAAGIGAFLKAVMAVNRRVLPPTAGCEQPNPAFDGPARRLYPILLGRQLDPGETVRAGVSAMGFGGINTHVTLESAGPPSPRLTPSLEERALLVSNQDAEALPASAPSVAALIERLESLAETAAAVSYGELADLAAHEARSAHPSLPARAAVVADTPEGTAARLRALTAQLRERPLRDGEVVSSAARDAWASLGRRGARVAFLFPGQGSQQLGMARKLIERHPSARALARRADTWVRDAGGPADLTGTVLRQTDRAADGEELEAWRRALAQTEVAQPAICLASVLWARHLQRLGLSPITACGHSLGELTAFHIAGAFDDEALLRLAAARGLAMAAPPGAAGAMTGLSCSREAAQALVDRAIQALSGQGYAVLANINAPAQIIVSGEAATIAAVEREAAASGIERRRLPVSNAFHSRLIAPAAERLARFDGLPPRLIATPVRLLSGLSGGILPEGTDLRAYFAAQALGQVDFVSLVRALREGHDLLLEVGPGRVLSALAGEILGEGGPPCLPVAGKADSERDLAIALSAAFCLGVPVRWAALYEQRLVRPFTPASARTFIDNPCERPIIAPDLGVRIDRAGGAGALIKTETGVAVVPPRPAPVEIQDREAQAAPASTAEMIVEMAVAQTGFPRAQVTQESRLLDDLNLDSIKAGSLIAAAAQRLGVAGRIDAARHANARIGEIAAALDDAAARPAGDAAAGGSAGEGRAPAMPASAPVPSWARTFVVDLVEEPAEGEGSPSLQGARALLLCDPAEADVAEALAARLQAAGVVCERAAGDEADGQVAALVIAVLPRRFTAGEGEDDRARLRAAAARLRAAVARLRAEERAALVFVQFGGGRFGTDGADCALPEACAAVGFAASVHLERPAARVRVVDVSPRASADAVAGAVLCELGGQAPFAAAGHDLDGVRRVRRARVSSPAAAPRRALRLGPDDVVLVTGGARGITAECALGLGRATSARFALLGSSALDADPDGEIRRTLERFAAAGLRALYLRCDMTRYGDVAAAIARAREELGPITAVVHGAGLNRPRRAEQVRLDDAVAEAAPKLLGGLHLCRALSGSPPRLFIAMTSVIGVTGVPGNAWYAWANASLDLLLRRFGERHGVQVAGAAFSVWDEVGMGARLGSVEALGRLGIGAIPIEEGVRRFLALVERDPGDAQAIITARMGSPVLDTWPAAAPSPPSGRFTTRALRFTPGVEWVGRATLSHDADRYVADHLYRGSYLFPTVFGLEAMTQAAAAALGGGPCDVARIEGVSLSRPIVVPAGATEEIEIHAEVLDRAEDGACAVRAGIRAAASGFSVDHFAATLILGEPEAGPQGEEGDAAEAAHDLQPGRDLYGPVLFQGPLFQRIAAVDALGGGRVTLRAEARESSLSGDEGFGPGAQGRGALRLGDPYLRDAMLQSVQLIIPRTSCLPIAISRIERYAGGELAGPRQVRAVLLRREGDEFVTDVEARDGWGRVVERLRGYRLRILHEVPGAPSAEELARPGERDERLLRDAAARAGLRAPALALVHAPGLHALPRKDRHEAERPLIARAWAAWRGDAAPACAWDDDGRPRFAGTAAGEEAGPGLSISHDESYCLCAVGPGPQGCDLAPVSARTDEEWRALLGDQRAAVRAALQRRGDPQGRAATRVWAAAEAARKALGAAHIDLSVAEGGQGEAVVLTASAPAEGRSCQVLTAPVTLARGPERVIALVLHSEPAAEPAVEPAVEPAPSPSPSPLGEAVHLDEETGRREQRRRFIVTFEEANTVGRRVGAARYGRLIGRVRELAFAPFAGQVLPEIAAGQLGLVTNSTTLTVLGDLTALDVVEARLHLRELRDPAATIGFEFYKVRPDGGAELVAVAWQGFTWVRVLGHGAVAPEPMPPALRDFLTSMQLDAAALRGLTPRRPEVSGPAHLGPVLRRDLARTLTEEVLPTTLEHGNLVGNIYWANYLGWAAALLDHFVQSVNPAYVRPGGAAGELLCTSIAVDHAREAMPFDRIRVSLVVRAVSERGATLDVHFFREGHAAPAGSVTERARLAAGRIEVAWTDRAGGVRSPAPWPDDLRGALLILDDDEEEAARAG